MPTLINNKNTLPWTNVFLFKAKTTNTKWLKDFKKYLISSWKKDKENISENIDNIIYK
jgi:hypothetical protein